jgi:hypothetical protein
LNYYNYFTEIEETFVRRRGKHLLLSPIDWAMIESWQDRGVPLHIVIRAIESVFDGFDKKPGSRSIKGLLYCREEIEAQYEEWLAMSAGKAREETNGDAENFLPQQDIAEHIQNAVEKLKAVKNENLREDIERACARLEELKENLSADMELIDGSLADIEGFLDKALLTNSGRDTLKEAGKEVTLQLKAYKSSMDDEVYKKTFDLMMLKRLREESDITRLSLFYL